MIVSGTRSRRVLRIKRTCKVRRLRGLAAAALLGLSFLAMLVSSLLVWPWVFVGAALLSYGADVYLHRAEPSLMRVLSRRRAGVTIRVMGRVSLLVPLMIGIPSVYGWGCHFLALSAVLLTGGMALFSTLTDVISRRRKLPVTTRNIRLPRLDIEDTPPRWLTGWPGQRLLHHEAVIWIGLIATVATGTPRWAHLGVAVSGTAMLLTLAALMPHVSRARRSMRAEQMLAQVDGWLSQYRPDVILYFSGSRDSAYQINMWLECLSALDARPLILLRERHLLNKLDLTHLPVLCVPSAIHLMNMDLSSVRVALYSANVGKNIHLLRVPTIKHVFIGHGDSDKIASINPYTKVYDEVWVAGPAGRERYAQARVGVADTDIIEVGRPQLDRFQVPDAPRSAAPAIPTVLYAPTWEGWTDDPGNTSLITAGENIITELLSIEPPVRIIYKPHPFTGIRDSAARTAHERILRLLARANAHSARRLALQDGAQSHQRRAAALRELRTVEGTLDQLKTQMRCATGDEAQRSRDTAQADLPTLQRIHDLQQKRTRLFWAAHAPYEHAVIEPDGPHLYDCFDQADLLISDISSVVSDFIATLKPYALTDTAGLGPQEFCRLNTAARGAYLLTPDARGVRGLVDLLRFPAHDTLRHRRQEIRGYLLGPATPSSTTRFAQALTSLAARGRAELLPDPAAQAPLATHRSG
ncbi:hypothetical protein ACMATS_37575 [Streptoverticillium reticulum]|uniref:hypothetical protein n=1 Tax=Streptoverticillium reticulum TaxID=1433415 RepID=UPI0039BF9767